MTKVQSHVMLVLQNVRMIPSKCEKKNKGTIECNKSTVICDVGIAQCDNGIVKCEEKIKVPLNVRKVQ